MIKGLFSNKKIALSLILKLIITVCAIVFLIKKVDISLEKITRTYNGVNREWFALVSVTAILIAALQIIRWHEHIKAAGYSVSYRKTVSSWFAGNLLAILTPGRIAELGRGLFLDRTMVKEGAKITIAERSYFIAAVLIFLAIGLAIMSNRLIAIFGIKLFASSLFPIFILVLLSLVFLIKKDKINPFGLFDALPRQREKQLYLINLSLILCALMVIQAYAVFNIFATAKLSSSYITVHATMAALMIFPITIGNIGVREGLFVFFLSRLENYPPESAVSAGFVIFLFNVALPALPGIIPLLTTKQLFTGFK